MQGVVEQTAGVASHVSYSQQYRRCGKAACRTCRDGRGHGPYWYAVWRDGGRVRRRYVGRTLPAGLEAVPAAGPAAYLAVRTLGDFTVWRQGKLIEGRRWGRRQAGNLFKLLLAAPGYQVGREAAAEQLWPEAPGATGRRNLYGAVHEVRLLLGAELLRLEGELVRLVVPGEEPWLDAAVFEAAAQTALASREITVVRGALARYGGVYLAEDPYAEWALARREQLAGYQQSLLLHLAELAGGQGEPGEAEAALRRLVAADPCHEEAAARLMAVLAAGGRPREALRVYEGLAAALAEELGVRPSRDVVALQARLLGQQSAPRAAGIPPAQPVESDVGTGRTNLPRALSPFIGRQQEQASLPGLLAGTRLLTLIGPGGVGKTRLALALAAKEELPADGIWLVELAGLAAATSLVGVARAVAAVLGVQEQATTPVATSVAEFLAPRQMLLVLDNCEHLRGAAGALAVALLAAAPGLRMLATSRARLGVPGETVYAVPPLACPPAGTGADLLATYDASALFVARAGLAGSLGTGEAAAIGEICAELEGIPLAIELAAARAATMPLRVLAGRLAAGVAMLSGGPRTGLARQRTLAATLAWSEALLAPAERTLLARLAVFAGGWTLEGAEAVCADEAALPATSILAGLSGLVSQSLVQLNGETRYRLLAPVRQYAWARLAADELAAVRRAHLAWCVTEAEEGEPALWEGASQGRWLERLSHEHENCRAALAWALEAGEVTLGLRLASALRRYWDLRGYRREGEEWLERLLAASSSRTVAPALCAKALVAAASLTYGLGCYDAASTHAAEALAIYERLDDPYGMGSALHVLGNVAGDREQLDRAQALYSRALEHFRFVGSTRQVANMLSNLGVIACFRRQYSRGIPLLEEARELLRALSDPVLQGQVLANLGGAAMHTGDLVRAKEILEESLRCAKQSGSRIEHAISLSSLAALAIRSGDYGPAMDQLRQCVDLLQGSGDQYALTLVLVYLLEIAAGTGDMQRASTLYGAAMAHCETAAMNISGPTWDGLERARCAAEAVLGRPAFAGVCERGRRLTLEQAVSLALAGGYGQSKSVL